MTAPQIALAKFTSAYGTRTPTLETEFYHIFVFDDDNYLVDSNHESMQSIKNNEVNFSKEDITEATKDLIKKSDAEYEKMKREMYAKNSQGK